jgi:hypothetical protein
MEVPLWDQFQQRTVELSGVEQFCKQVDKNGEGILDPAAHLTCYKVKRPRSKITPEVISSNQFDEQDEEQQLTVKRGRNQLCVPSEAIPIVDPTPTPTGPPAPTATPMPGPPLEHFELYKVKRTPRTPKFERREVNLVDEFLDQYIIDENETTVTVKLTRPVQLSVPTAEFYKDIVNPLTHLTCYKVRAPRFRRLDVIVSNQFDPWYKLTVKRPNMLCVPSYKQVVSDN